MIVDAQELAALVARMEGHSRIAVDTEADSLHSYYEKLCLVQISLPGIDALVDPLAGFSLQPLLDAFSERTIVLQGADFDLRMLRRAGEYRSPKVFDTVVASRLAGLTDFGLAALVKQFFGVVLSKGSQKANWARRPLDERMQTYARNDTHYLLPLSAVLEEKLVALGRVEWFQQSCEKVLRGTEITREKDPEEVWRISGSAALSPRAGAILRALWHWREGEAQAVDRPSFHVLRNEELLNLSADIDQGRTPYVSHLRGSRLKRFEEIVEQARAIPEAEWPQRKFKPRLRTTPEMNRRLDSLRKMRDQVAKDLALDPSIIAAKSSLETISIHPELTAETLLPWQRGLLGL